MFTDIVFSCIASYKYITKIDDYFRRIFRKELVDLKMIIVFSFSAPFGCSMKTINIFS